MYQPLFAFFSIPFFATNVLNSFLLPDYQKKSAAFSFSYFSVVASLHTWLAFTILYIVSHKGGVYQRRGQEFMLLAQRSALFYSIDFLGTLGGKWEYSIGCIYGKMGKAGCAGEGEKWKSFRIVLIREWNTCLFGLSCSVYGCQVGYL